MGIRLGIGGLKIGQGSTGINWSSYWSTLISATVETAAPTHVVLTFPTAQTSLGASDFTIAGFTVSSASWTGAVLTLVLSSAVIVFDGDLTITFVPSGGTATVTNNVADDGNTVFWGNAATDSCETDVNNLVTLWWDKTHKKALGELLTTGSSVVGAAYLIVSTEADHFRAGLGVGDVYFADTPVTIDANNTLRRYLGNSLGQPAVAKRPLKTATNIYFQGVDQSVYSSLFGFEQPEYVYLVIKQKGWTSGMGIFDGYPGALTGSLYQTGSTPEVRIRAGSGVAGNTELIIDEWHIARIELNGASSKLKVDNNDATTGDPGAGDMNGIRIGGIGVDCAEFELMEAVFRSSDANWDAIYNSLLRKYDFFFNNVIKIGWMTDNHILSTAVEDPETPTIVGGLRYLHTSKQCTRQAIDYFNAENVDLIIDTGDIIDDPDAMAHFMEEWSRGIAKKELTIGGHDLGGNNVIETRATLVSGFGYGEYPVNGGSPFNQSFVLNNEAGVVVRIILLDANKYTGEGYTLSGQFTAETLTWLGGILSASQENNIFIFLHYAPHTWDENEIFEQASAEAINQLVADDLIANPSHRISCFAGHDHGYGDIRIVNRPGWANWTCYVGRKSIVDYDQSSPYCGGFMIIRINEAGNFVIEEIDKIFPYTS